jgi:curli production assembly/transport component CsgE
MSRIETLIPGDLSEVTGTLAQVMIYENAMKLNDGEVSVNQNYLYSISELIKIKDNMDEENGKKGKVSNKKLRKLKPILDISLQSLDSTEWKLGDMTYRKKMLQKMMLETLFRVGERNVERELGEGVFLEVDGLVVDQTVSKVGREFYEFFFSNWDPPIELKNFSVTIKEMPPRMNRVSVSVLINDDEVFSSFLSPRPDVIEAYAMYAIELAVQHLVEMEDVSRTLEEGDMSGTGIF